MKFKSRYSSYVSDGKKISEVVKLSLNGADYGQGHLEDLERTVQNIQKAFGDLIEILYNKGSLTKDDVKTFVASQYEEIDIK